MINLDQSDRDLIAHIELQRERPISEIASEIGIKPSTARRRLDRLWELGVIQKSSWYADTQQIGILSYQIFLTVGTSPNRNLTSSVSELQKLPFVSWIATVGGDFQILISLEVRSPLELPMTLNELYRHLSVPIYDKLILYRVGMEVFPREYLNSTKNKLPKISVGFNKETIEIDELDKRIIYALFEFSNSSYRDVARSLGIPQATFAQRIARLKLRGVLSASIYGFRHELLGYNAYRILIGLNSLKRSDFELIREFSERHPHIRKYIEFIGGWDLELEADFSKGEDVSKLVSSLYQNFSHCISKVKVIPLFQHVYYGAHKYFSSELN